MASLSLLLTAIVSTLLHDTNAQTRYTNKGRAECGQHLTGSRSSNEFVYYSWTAPSSYDSVHIESCLSDHDTVLYLFNSQGQFVKSADDVNDHPNPAQCTNRYSGDLTFDSTVNQGDTYFFGIYGYNAQAVGRYSMILNCGSNSNPAPAPVPVPVPPSNCNRHRRPWHQLTVDERDLYISGFHRLSEMGRMKIFTRTHVEDNAEAQAHGSSAFLPWHRWFVYELESQIRDLGGKWRCFSMPYWDWTYEVSVYGTNVWNFNILNSGLGGRGDAANNYCIMDGIFRRNNYETHWCIHDRSCCLRRNPRQFYSYPNAADMMQRILNWRRYGGDTTATGDISSSIDGYRESLEGRPHAVAHVATAGSSQFHLGSMSSPDDPIFYLLHTFVDYQWALWQDCHDFDLVTASNINNIIYIGGLMNIQQGGPSRIDDAMLYPILSEQSWSYLNRRRLTITPRRMHSIQSNYMDYSYEKGSFWESANVDRVCRNINSNWFYNDNDNGQRRLVKNIDTDIDEFGRLSFEMVFNGLQIENGESNEKELFDSWVKLQCEYDGKNIPNDCKERPRYFEDCITMKDKFKGKKDIDITLPELLNKKGLSECMIETRTMFYHWAKRTYQLYRLCNGDFDAFCDINLTKNEAEQVTCYDNEGIIQSVEDNMDYHYYDYYQYGIFGLVIMIQTVAIMYLIYKRNDKNIIYQIKTYVDDP